MSNPNISNEAIKRLLVDVKIFDSMSSAQKAAFRARVSRYLGVVGDTDSDTYDATLTDILTAVQNKVGASAKRKTKKLTVDDIIEEYREGIDTDDPRKLGAFRAKAKRLMNRSSNPETIAKIKNLLQEIEDHVNEMRREAIINMAIKAGLIEEDDTSTE